jgi:hypothetical protein
MRPDRRADMTKLIVAFHNFANAPKKVVRHLEHFLIKSDNGYATLILPISSRRWQQEKR